VKKNCLDRRLKVYKGIFYLGLGFTRDEGILSTIPYILNETLLDQLSENWDQLGSQIVFGKCCLFSTEELAIARQIR
jgi:hypothetical protein